MAVTQLMAAAAERARSTPLSLSSRFRIALVGAVLGIQLAAVLALALYPTVVDEPYYGTLQRLVVKLHEQGLPAWIGYGELEFGSNLLLFVPVGFLAALVLRRRDWWLVAVLAPVLSALLESAQALFLPERYPMVSDVVANGIGGALGAVVSLVARVLVHKRDRLLAMDLTSGTRTLE